MALLTELVAKVAEVEGLPETFVAGIAKYLREADHIRQGGRGLSAARMNPRDAANLLIAVNATRLAKDAVEAFETYGVLEWWPVMDTDDLEDSRLNLLVAVLSERIRFADALTKLISLAVWSDSYRPPLDALFANDDLRLDITFSRPKRIVQVEVRDRSDQDLGVMFRGVFYNEPNEEPAPDRRDLVTITHRTILEVGKTLAS